MKPYSFILYTVCISPHQLPLMRAMMERLDQKNCLYIYTEKLENGRKDLGWNEEREVWLVYEKERPDFCR